MKNNLIKGGTYQIFGTPTAFYFDCAGDASRLSNELSSYPTSDEAPSCTIRILKELPPAPSGTANPKIHISYDNGFQMEGRMYRSQWRWNGTQTEVDISIKRYGRALSLLYRAAHRQNTTREEMAGQILHEGILVPRLLTSDSHALLHASAIADPSGQRIFAIGGTGGSGKTSLMLHACLEENWRFAADDITVLTTDGRLWPNYSYPKVYGYNLEAFPKIAPKLFEDDRPFDKIHWKLHKIRGLDKVRRRIAPKDIFNTLSETNVSILSDYIILQREHRQSIDLSRVTSIQASSASSHVIASEYTEFLKHLHWHSFNRQLTSPSHTSRFSLSGCTDRIKGALTDTRCWLLRFPDSLSHRDFLNEAWPLIREL